MSTPEIQDFEELPASSYDLIDLLNTAFPHQCARPGQDRDEMMMYAGVRNLIDQLVDIKNEELQPDDDDIDNDPSIQSG